MRIVEAAELEPAGWVCESCKTPFHVGDVVLEPEWVGMVGGTPLFEGFRCVGCGPKETA